MSSPIVLFVYNRLEKTKFTIRSLVKNNLAQSSELYIFSDGPKNAKDKILVTEVRNFINSISGFKNVKVFESENNIGLADSIINGVNEIFKNYKSVIVLEDDLISSPNFLNFMNQALDFYEGYPRIHSISGYSLNLKFALNLKYDNYFGRRASSWGWATWKDRWEKTDWEVKGFNKFRLNPIQRYKFNRAGSDMSRMLINQQKGKIDSWAIRWCYSQFKNDQITVFPKISKIQNIGIGENATHTKLGRRFCTRLDKGDQRDFEFDENLNLHKQIEKEFRSFFSYKSRILNKINF